MQEKIEEVKDFLLDKIYYLLIIIIILLVLVIVFFNNNRKKEDDVVLVDNNILEEEKFEECFVNVDIKGYINNPGLYQVECNKCVNDVINIAGGLKDNSDTSVINLGKKVFDEMVIIIYSKEEVASFTKVIEKNNIVEEKCINNSVIKNDACVTKENRVEVNISVADIKKERNKISINSASLEELMTLTGIGESKAKAIIKYREDNGGFNTIEDIKNVSGIGEKAFEKIKNNITL